MFQPTVFPEIEFELIIFSGGELHIKLNKRIDYFNVTKVVITHRVNCMNDVMAILIAVDALERLGIKHFDLVMPYIPYARQDRYDYNENIGESFTLSVFANLINSAGFDNVYSWDAHSDVSKGLIKYVHDRDNSEYVIQAIDDSCNTASKVGVATTIYTRDKSPIWLISPDSGANKKINSLHTKLSKEESFTIEGVVKCDKKRDVATGKLSGFTVPDMDFKGLNGFIVDDICDGGGTFIGLAEELRKRNVGKLYLFVTHGIFSKGIAELSEIFEKIYCTDSIKDISESWDIKQLKIYL